MESDETWIAQGSGPGQTGPDDLGVGDRLGEYAVLGALGRGAMGQVYEVEHARLKRRYALKLLPAALAHDRGFSERFEREGATLASLEHPGIVQVHYAGEDGGRFYLVMERLQPLFTDADAGQTHPPEKVASILNQMLEALGYAHARNVIHRDLKPANLLATADGRVKIADFGVARVVGDDFIQTMVQETISKSRLGATATIADSGGTDLAGTLYYIAPEILNGGEADTRSDLYAVGVIGYELLTGKKPMGRYKDASKCVPGLNPRWDDFINRLLEPDPDDRFANAGDTVAALTALDAPNAPPPVPAPSRAAAVPPPPPSPSGLAATGDTFQAHLGGGATPQPSPPPVTTPPPAPRPTPTPEAGPGAVGPKRRKRRKVPALLVLFVLFAAGAGAAAYFGGEELWDDMVTFIIGPDDRSQENRDEADAPESPRENQFFPIEDEFFPQQDDTEPSETNPALARQQAFTQQQNAAGETEEPAETTNPVAAAGIGAQRPEETNTPPETPETTEPETSNVAAVAVPTTETPTAQPIERILEPDQAPTDEGLRLEPEPAVAANSPQPGDEARLGQDPGGADPVAGASSEVDRMQNQIAATNQEIIARRDQLIQQQQEMARLSEQIEVESAQMRTLQQRLDLMRSERQAAANDLAAAEAQPPKEIRRPLIGGGTRTVRIQENQEDIDFLREHVAQLDTSLAQAQRELAATQARLSQSFGEMNAALPEDTSAPPPGTDAETVRRVDDAASRGDVATLERLAERGIAEAQTALANLFEEGRAVPRDYAQAAQWYERAADAGDPEAQYKLGWHYENGFGVTRNPQEAYRLYSLAAESGNATAQYRIGASYVRGSNGQPRDYEKALRWFREAAASDHSEAQFSMGMLYESGLGVPTDPALALAWYQRAADNGNARAKRKVDAILSQQR
ncbi:MAG: protein kinase [Opitutales bacterium]